MAAFAQLLLALFAAMIAAAAPGAAVAAAAPGAAVAGNGAQCNVTAGGCPCGADPPVWPTLGAAVWCPAGCADAQGAPDETGDFVVDVRAVCAAQAFAAWQEPSSHDALAVAGCPLNDAPRVSLQFFRPCVNVTALLAGDAASCTPCAQLPDPPSPPPPSPPATPPSPPPEAPQGAVEVVETTLCLAGVADDVNLDAVSGAIAALLGVDVADVAVSVVGALVGGCVSAPAPPARRLLQQSASVPPAPASTSTAVSVAVTTRGGAATSAIDVAAALQQLEPAESLALVDAMQRLGEPRISAVRLSSTGSITVTAAPAPPSAPPPAAPAVAPAALKTGEQLLPLRIVFAVVIGASICCALPCVLLGLAAWNAAVHVIIMVGVRGVWDDCAMVDVPLAEKGDAAAPQTPLDAAASALEAACSRFFNERMDSRHVRTVDVRSLQPAEAALHAPLLWRGAAKPSAGSAPVDGDEVEASFAVTAVFRSPAVAWQWRASVDACADGRGLAHELTVALASAVPPVTKLRASIALLRPAPRDEERAGAVDDASAAPLKRRATLFVTSHPLRK